MPNNTKKENPLLSKNIPRPPLQTTRVETIGEPEKGITVKEQKAKTATSAASEPITEPEEKATVEISLYLRPSQDDKLEDLKREYKRRMRKKISSNQIMRLLIERATVEDLL